MKAPGMHRYVMHVVYRPDEGRWHVEEAGGSSIGAFATHDEAKSAGRMRGDRLHEDGRNSRLVVHREDGSVEAEYTYGLDPVDSPG